MENTVSKLMSLRENWDLQDFKDAYEDEWDEMPDNVEECREMMEEYIEHTYDEEYFLSFLPNG